MKLEAAACVLLFLSAGALVRADEPTTNDVKDTIVIQTPLKNYEQPSLRDYEECQSNRRSCMNVCMDNQKCKTECPLCPDLIEEPLLVHGINDSTYVAPAQSAYNTTNIIRLTNEINNIIKNDIKERNEMNVQVHQNVSQVGGRFGLGYNEHGSCCFVVRRERECEHLEDCEELSRHRVCGTRCQARVMHAKRVVSCKTDQPDVCSETVEYMPAHRHKSKKRYQNPLQSQSQFQSSDCKYLNSWPYVSCGPDKESQRVRRTYCQACLYVTYGYILQYGIPPECIGCFSAPLPVMQPTYWNPSFGFNYLSPFAPVIKDQVKDEEHEQQSESNKVSDIDNDGDDKWVLKSEKCLDPNGEIMDCKDTEFKTPHVPSQPPDLEIDDDYYDVPAQRRKRRQGKFMRSLYSRRTD